jgi:hypothetical protein
VHSRAGLPGGALLPGRRRRQALLSGRGLLLRQRMLCRGHRLLPGCDGAMLRSRH